MRTTAQSWRRLSLKHPLSRLWTEFKRAKLPLEVRRQVWDLFAQVKSPRSLTEDQAQHEARRLECHIQLLRVRHGLMLHDPSTKEHFTLSKSASLWLRNLDKVSKDSRMNGKGEPLRKRVPTAAPSQRPNGGHEGQESDGEEA